MLTRKYTRDWAHQSRRSDHKEVSALVKRLPLGRLDSEDWDNPERLRHELE
jgi:hypothetical protein